jgi:hypothetical protein
MLPEKMGTVSKVHLGRVEMGTVPKVLLCLAEMETVPKAHLGRMEMDTGPMPGGTGPMPGETVPPMYLDKTHPATRIRTRRLSRVTLAKSHEERLPAAYPSCSFCVIYYVNNQPTAIPVQILKKLQFD